MSPVAPSALAAACADDRTRAEHSGHQPATSDVIRGRVTESDGTPVVGAEVVITSAVDGGSRTLRTGVNGLFATAFPAGGDSYVVRVRALGFRPEQRRAVRARPESPISAVDFELERLASVLTAVRVRGERLRPRRGEDAGPASDPGAFATRRYLNAGGATAGDPTGDLAAALDLVPGLTVTADPNGGLPQVSVLGLPADQSITTLNGLTFAGGALPRDATTASVSTSTSDPGRGGFTGAQVDVRLRQGSNRTTRSLRFSGEHPRLQWYDAAASGAAYTRGAISGTAAGALVRHRVFYSFGGQWQRTARDLVTLGDLLTLEGGPARLTALGLSADSVARLQALAAAAGLPARAGGVPDRSLADQYSVTGRLDAALSDVTVAALSVIAGGSRPTPLGIGPTAFAATALASDRQSVTVQPRLSTYFGGAVLNETSGSFSWNRGATSPYLDAPAALVRLASPLVTAPSSPGAPPVGGPSGAVPTTGATVRLGGAPAGRGSSTIAVAQLRNETSWYTLDSRHKLTVTVDGQLRRTDVVTGADQPGTFTFATLADFAANRPASYSRTLAARTLRSRQALGWIGVGDQYRVSDALQLQYGVQLAGAAVGARPAYNGTIDTLFGRRTNDVPRALGLSPRVGMVWTIPGRSPRPSSPGAPAASSGVGGGGGTAPPPNTFRSPWGLFFGSISRLEGSTPTSLIEQVAQQTGLAGAPLEVRCVGGASPSPDWAAYLRDPALWPTQCADGTMRPGIAGGIPGGTGAIGTTTSAVQGAPLALLAPPVSLLAPGFRPTESWRLSGLLRKPLRRGFALTMSADLGRHRNLPGFVDLNLDATPRFTLGAEGGRPVYVSPASLDAATGALSVAESRRSTQFGRVAEWRSDLASDVAQLGAALQGSVLPASWLSRHGMSLGGSVGYTWQWQRQRVRGFGGTTHGDPRTLTWTRGTLPVHTMDATARLGIRQWATLSAQAIVRSGRRFAPRVGGDINGDGESNDRAFVFDPQDPATAAADPALAAGMAALLAQNPEARRCLTGSLGRVAEPDVCREPRSVQFESPRVWRRLPAL